VAVPVPFLLMWAPSWNWILFANLLLGISQGLTWSTTVIMKIAANFDTGGHAFRTDVLAAVARAAHVFNRPPNKTTA
jgi:hypothetical protein